MGRKLTRCCFVSGQHPHTGLVAAANCPRSDGVAVVRVLDLGPGPADIANELAARAVFSASPDGATGHHEARSLSAR